MPAAIIPIVGAGLAAAGGYTAGFLGITGITGALLAGASSLALSALSGAFNPVKKPKAPATGISFNVRQAAAPWRVIYGRSRIGGVYSFMATTGGTNNKKLHMVITMAGHRIAAFERWWLDEEEITLNRDPTGDEAAFPDGRLANFVDVYARRGTADQTVPPGMIGAGIAAEGEWTAAHRQRGRAWSYWLFLHDPEKFPNGAPNVSALIKGRDEIYDPRDDTEKWTDNPALCLADYMCNQEFGFGADYESEMDEDFLIAAANVCDEMVPTVNISETFSVGKACSFSGYTSKAYTYQKWREIHDDGGYVTVTETVTNVIDIQTPGDVELERGTKVYLTGSSLPGGLSAGTAYYWIPVAFSSVDSSHNPTGNVLGKLATSLANAEAGTAITISANGTGTINATTAINILGDNLDGMSSNDVVRVSSSGSLPTGLSAGVDYYWVAKRSRRGNLATTLENARAGTFVAITSVGSGTLTITKTKEPRYTLNGTFTTDARPREIVERMLSAMAGRAIFVRGKWRLIAGAYQTPTITLDEDDLAGPIRIQALQSRRSSFNGVKGTFINPAEKWTEADFPSVTNAAYLTADNGERVWKDLEFAFTTSAGMSQRLAKIELERARQQIGAVLPCKLSALRVRAGDNIYLNNTRMGWSNKPFEVTESSFSVGQDGALGVELTVRETATTVYDWDSGEERALDPAPNTGLPSPFTTAPPTNLNVVEELYETRNSAGVKARAIVSWAAALDSFVRGTQIEYRLVGATAFTPAGEAPTPATFANLDDLAPGNYEFRIRSLSILSQPSTWITKTVNILGLLAPPSSLTGLNGLVISGLAQLSWDQSVDLDVRIGGRIEWRHSPLTVGAAWNNSSPIGLAVPGQATFTILPYIPGTYLVKPYDSSGIPASAASSVVIDIGPAPGSTLDSLAEEAAFSGTKTNLVVDGSTLTLDTGEVSGTYEYANFLDVTTVQAIRVSRSVEYTVVARGDLIDDRGFVDDWADVDGASDADAGEVTIWFAVTNDNPAATAAWSPWMRLDGAADVLARGVRFKAEVMVDDVAYNVIISALGAKAESLP